jgi:hypothetical protein
MLHRGSIGSIALAAALTAAIVGAQAHDETKYPDWSGQWRGRGNQWDPTKPFGRGQQPPLTPEYRAIFEASIADQKAGGPGGDTRFTCLPPGMPRMMTAVFPMEFVFTPEVTFILFENMMPRRIYTDGRDWPNDAEPAYAGYSVGKWIDTDADGRYDVLEIETRNMNGPRTFEPSGLPLHADNQTIVQERMYLDKASRDVLVNEVTTIDNALTHPWAVTKTYRREHNAFWFDNNCNENNPHVVIGKEAYFVGADGYLMPAKKDQPPPDLKYFRQTHK